MLLIRIVENNIIDAYFRAGYVLSRLALPRRIRVRKSIIIGPRRVKALPQVLDIGKKTLSNYFQ